MLRVPRRPSFGRRFVTGGGLFAAQPGLQLLSVLAAAFVENRDARRGTTSQRGENPDAQRKRDDQREQERNDERKIAYAKQASGTEDHRSQDDDEQQAGQDISQHVDHEAGSGGSIGHGPSLPTARIFR